MWYHNGHSLDFNETEEVFAEHTVCGCKMLPGKSSSPGRRDGLLFAYNSKQEWTNYDDGGEKLLQRIMGVEPSKGKVSHLLD